MLGSLVLRVRRRVTRLTSNQRSVDKCMPESIRVASNRGRNISVIMNEEKSGVKVCSRSFLKSADMGMVRVH